MVVIVICPKTFGHIVLKLYIYLIKSYVIYIIITMFHSLQNKTQSDEILSEVTKTMQSYPFDFRGARIITGMEEGAYGWITINYLLERFIKVGVTLLQVQSVCL